MPNSYRLTEQAEADLAEIADYTIERFGVTQARRYSEGLFKAFDLLVMFPHLGTEQGHIEQGLRRLVHASHSIYYAVVEDEVVIAALLGPGEDPLRRFSE